MHREERADVHHVRRFLGRHVTVGGGVAILDSRRGFLLFTRPLPVALNHDYYNTTVLHTGRRASSCARVCAFQFTTSLKTDGRRHLSFVFPPHRCRICDRVTSFGDIFFTILQKHTHTICRYGDYNSYVVVEHINYNKQCTTFTCTQWYLRNDTVISVHGSYTNISIIIINIIFLALSVRFVFRFSFTRTYLHIFSHCTRIFESLVEAKNRFF